MSNAIENMLSRRSIRKYRQDPIPEDILNKILEAGTYAPTGMNKQAPIILAVTNREMRDRLSKMNAAVMGVESDPFYGAPVVLVVLANKARSPFLRFGKHLDSPRQRGVCDRRRQGHSEGAWHRGRLRGRGQLHSGLCRLSGSRSAAS